MKDKDYWEECVANAAEECGAVLTDEQVSVIAEAASAAHKNYGMAFYSPPDSDRRIVIEREWAAKLDAKQRELDSYRENAETAVRQALGQRRDASVSIGKDGEVFRHGGRTDRIQ